MPRVINIEPDLARNVPRLPETRAAAARPRTEQRDMPEVWASDRHPLLEMVHQAYDNHLGLELRPGDILYVLMQQFALWQVQEDAALRPDDRKTLVVIRDSFVRGGDNDWPGAFPEFMTLMEETKESFPDFSTDTPAARVGRAAAMMEAFQRRYKYEVHTRCGLRFVSLLGEASEWRAVADWARASGCPGVAAAAPILERAFVDADARVWNDVYKLRRMSGGERVDGWVLSLFPYYSDAKGAVRLADKGSRSVRDFPASGMAGVPFVWKYCGTSLPMRLHAGMAGARLNEAGDAAALSYGWELTYVDEKE